MLATVRPMSALTLVIMAKLIEIFVFKADFELNQQLKSTLIMWAILSIYLSAGADKTAAKHHLILTVVGLALSSAALVLIYWKYDVEIAIQCILWGLWLLYLSNAITAYFCIFDKKPAVSSW